MQLTNEVVWQAGDFMVAGMLLLMFGYVHEVLRQHLTSRVHKIILTGCIAISFLLIWAILAVDLI